MRYAVNGLLSLVFSARNEVNETNSTDDSVADDVSSASSGTNPTQSNLTVAVDVDAEFQFGDAIHETTSTKSSESANESPGHITEEKKSHPYSTVTMDSWTRHMAPYAEPPHVSVRTSQMHGVGFPVDHSALLWCNQVLKSVNTYMKKIVHAGHNAEIDIASIVKLKSEFRVTTPEDVIPPLAAYLWRNASQAMYSGLAVDSERIEMYAVLNKSSLWLMATVFNTSYLSAIVSCYFLVPLLVMATAMLYEVGDKKSWAPRPKSDFEALLPSNHLCLGIFDDVFMIICPQLFCYLKSNAVYVITPIIAMCIGVMALDYSDPILFLHRYGMYFQWGVSYGVAVFAHMLFLGIVIALRRTSAFCASVAYTIIRWTIWCDWIRYYMKFGTKPVKKLFKPLLNLLNLEFLLGAIAMGAILVGVIVTKQRIGGVISFVLVCTCVCYVVATASFLFIFLTAVVWKPKRSSKYLQPTLALYLPAILLAKPSLYFCWSLIFDKLPMLFAMSRVYEIFGPELINYSLCLTCIVCDLIMSLR